MTDNWDDSDDEWDVDDDALDNKLGLKKTEEKEVPTFDDEEDLTAKEKAEKEKADHADLKKKGTALQQKRQAELKRQEEEELARKVMELELEAESNMTPDELRAHKQRQIEQADNALTDDLFGNVDSRVGPGSVAAATAAGDKIILKDLKDHLKHARKVTAALKAHGKTHFVTTYIKELIEGTKDVLDEAAVSDIIKALNVIKNEKVQAAKRKVKGQAQKSKKVDKAAEKKARQIQVETFGDNDQYDEYDEIGADYEDDFF